MNRAGRPAGLALLLVSMSLSAQHEPAAKHETSAKHESAPQQRPAVPSTAGHDAQPATKATGGKLTDALAAELAKNALAAEDPASIKAVLTRLKGHSFKSSKVPEREMVLYAQGILEARLGNLPAASVALKKLERQWPKSPFMGEAQTILAEAAVIENHYKEAEGRLHQALASDMASERKRKPQELLIWTLVEQGRPQEALPIVQALRPLEGKEKPSEKGLVGIIETLADADEREQAQGGRKDFMSLYPTSPLLPRVELAWGKVLGRTGDAKESAQVLRKLIKDHPKAPQADDARLSLANLLTDGSLPDTKGMPTPESLLAEVRKGGKGLPKGAAQAVELRLLVGKSLWEEALNLVDHMEAGIRASHPEVKKLWTQAWNEWVGQRLEKGFSGELLTRLRPGAFAALESKARTGVVELLAANGLLEVLPRLIPEAPVKERVALHKAALAKVQPEAQPQAVLSLLPAKGDTPDEALMRARAEAALEHWVALRKALARARPGPERIKATVRLLQRPLVKPETNAQRLMEAEGCLTRAPEKGEVREPLAILVADLRFRKEDARGALALYPAKATGADQRGWVALMRAQAQVKLGQKEQARLTLKEARDEQGFKGQRDLLAKGLGAY